MTWQELDRRMRDGAVLVFYLNFGAWLEVDGKWQVNVNRNAAKALLRRDLAVVHKKVSAWVYVYRSKYIKPNRTK